MLALLPVFLKAQQKPTHEFKMFLSDNGKLYIAGDLPIYLWLSNSPSEQSKKYRLKSEESPQYTNPMYFDTDGYNTFRSPSAVDTVTRKTVMPLRDIIFEVYSDGTSPKTKVDYGESKPYNSDGKKYIMNNTKISLLSNDDQSGVEVIYYSVDEGPWNKYSSPITFSEEREYVLKYFAVDNVGNSEKITEVKYVYDKSSPVTKRTINKDEHNNVISARSTIALEAEDKGIGLNKIIYSINNGKEYTYTRPLKAYNLSQGEHTLSYYAIDKAGNKEPKQSYSFYIDKSAPTIIEEVIAKTFFANGKEYASGKAQLKLTAFDNKAGVKEIHYSINGGEYLIYTKPVFLTESAGKLSVKTYAVDKVNNSSNSQTNNQQTAIPYIDLSGPSLSFNIKGPQFKTRDTIFVNSNSKVLLRGYDQESGMNRIEYRINGKENLTYENGITLSNEGVHTISFVGYDNVENTSSKEFFVKVDNTGPSISSQFSTASFSKSDGKPNYHKYSILFLSGSDNVVGLSNIKYGFGDATPVKIYAAPISGFSLGEKTVRITAIDKLGNKTQETLNFNIIK